LIDRARLSLTDEVAIAELAARRAQVAFLSGDLDRARTEAELALGIADPRGLQSLMADAIITKSNVLQYEQRFLESHALRSLGLEIAIESDVADQALRAYFNLSEDSVLRSGKDEAAAVLDRGISLARERGNRVWERDLLAQKVGVHAFSGEWDKALELSDSLRAAGEDDSSRLAASYRPLIFAARGELAALDSWLVTPEGSSEWHELDVIENVARALALRANGRLDEALPLMTAVAPELAGVGLLTATFNLGEVFDGLIEAGELALVEELAGRRVHSSMHAEAAQLRRGHGLLLVRRGQLAEAESELAQAATLLRAAGNPYALGRALFDDGSVLVELGRTGEATAVLQKARSLFAALGATPWVERAADALAPIVTVA
jgi:tetratricopeptide (TPR) repeat protein